MDTRPTFSVEKPTSFPYKLPELRKNDIRGKERIWSLEITEDYKLKTCRGMVGGKITITYRTVEPKRNVILAEQCWNEAVSRHRDKLQEGWKETTDCSSTSTSSRSQTNLIKPTDEEEWNEHDNKTDNELDILKGTVIPFCMLGTDISKRSKLSFPLYAQGKRDGCRVVAIWDKIKQQVGLYTRTRRPWYFLDHLRESLAPFLSSFPHVALDGELYCHGMLPQTITSIVSQEKSPHLDEHKIEINIFDCIFMNDPNVLYSNRRSFLEQHITDIKSVILVDEIAVNSMDELEAAHKINRKARFEGTMLRPDLPYASGRSVTALLKYKFLDSMDSTIIDVSSESKGTEEGCAIFILQLPNGKTMKQRPTGPLEDRKRWLQNPEEVIGKTYTFSYSGLTKDGVPKAPKNGHVRVDLPQSEDK